MFLGVKFGFKAARSIMEGEELSINYLPILVNRLQIRRELKERWFFDCTCKRCASKSELNVYVSSPPCDICKQPLTPLSANDDFSNWTCANRCKEVTPAEVLSLDNQSSNRANDVISQGSLRAIEECVARMEEEGFAPGHHVVARLKMAYMKSKEEPEWEVSRRYCADLTLLYDVLGQRQETLRMKAKMKMAKLAKLLKERKGNKA